MAASKATVAVLGLGRMGAAIATRLAEADFSVRGYDVDAAAGADLVQPADSPIAAITGADVVLTVLSGTEELRALMIDDGVLDALPSGGTWIDCTSTAPDVAADLRARADQRQLHIVDCGLGGGPDEARAGSLTAYVGGTPDAVERCRPVVESFAAPERIFHVGGPGAGTLTKLLVNLLWLGTATLSAEVLLLAGAAGLDPARVAAVLPHTPAASAFTTDYVPRVLANDYLPAFGLDRLVEELDGLVRLAAATDTPFTTSAAVTRVHHDSLDRFGPVDGELLGVAHLEHLAGQRLTKG